MDGDYDNVKRTVGRDYWRIETTTSRPPRPDQTFTIAGRRRTSEPFWRPLSLPLADIGRVVAAIRQAAELVDAMAGQRPPHGPLYPAHDVAALCRGPYYVIEVAETSLGEGGTSILTTMQGLRPTIRPVLHLVDGEVRDFLADLERFAAGLSGPAGAARLAAAAVRTDLNDRAGRTP